MLSNFFYLKMKKRRHHASNVDGQKMQKMDKNGQKIVI